MSAWINSLNSATSTRFTPTILCIYMYYEHVAGVILFVLFAAIQGKTYFLAPAYPPLFAGGAMVAQVGHYD